MTAKIETTLTRQGDTAVAAVEAESMKNEFKDAELSCAEAKEALASARDLEVEELPSIHETTFLNGESVRINGGSRAAKLWTVVCVKHLWWSAFEQLHTDWR